MFDEEFQSLPIRALSDLPDEELIASSCGDRVEPSMASFVPAPSGVVLDHFPLLEYVSRPLTSFGMLSDVVPSSLTQT